MVHMMFLIVFVGAELTAVDAFNGSYRLEKLKSVTDKVFDAIDVLDNSKDGSRTNSHRT